MTLLDRLAISNALRIHRRHHAVQCSNVTGRYTDLLFANTTDFDAKASFTTDFSLLTMASSFIQPAFPANFFNQEGGRTVRITARGILGVTGTPTWTFTNRLGTTAGSTYLSGTAVGVSAAITAASGIANKYWEMSLLIQSTVRGTGSGQCTLSCSGHIFSPGGFASPFIYALEPTTPDTATWTTTIDGSLTQYLNLSVACNANSASNTIQCKSLQVEALN